MKTKIPLRLALLIILLGITIQTFSNSKNTSTMDTKKENIGLLVIMKAKPGKEEAVKDFLFSGLDLVNQEPQTLSWFAFQIDDRTFGIYDTFEVESGRQKHLTGEIAKVLLENAESLLENFNPNTDIKTVNLIAANHKVGIQNKGLFVTMKAKQGETTVVEKFLNTGAQLVSDEPETLSWYAIKIDSQTYAIFDTFTADSGRDTHLTGKIAAALMENAPIILDGFDVSAIQKIKILASK
ncbi:putative quinol monooxygenase [Aquimarina litoralis]|uniref:putative quinol monooxygenase n=1 Tax=Aquimarina litoralis TaxID=584605 RepID=UPI001C578555|nr:hypothetical protein [Aquimarina litoralis]MBW1294997.1 hypothetical protein [Aquimarina litoralis]